VAVNRRNYSRGGRRPYSTGQLCAQCGGLNHNRRTCRWAPFDAEQDRRDEVEELNQIALRAVIAWPGAE
jgi:hypothetical protein